MDPVLGASGGRRDRLDGVGSDESGGQAPDADQGVDQVLAELEVDAQESDDVGADEAQDGQERVDGSEDAGVEAGVGAACGEAGGEGGSGEDDVEDVVGPVEFEEAGDEGA